MIRWIAIYTDQSFAFGQNAAAADLIKKQAAISVLLKGSDGAKAEKVGNLTRKQMRDIAG